MPFSALHQIVHPIAHRMNALWPKQSSALRVAFGQKSGPIPEVYLVALAVLELLTGAAVSEPVTITVDDAQWIDGESARVLAFLARRIAADPIVLLAAAREGTDRF